MKKLIRPCALALAIASAFAAGPAAASVDLIAIGQLPADAADLSGQSYLLENGVPANRLGGLGSGLAWAGGDSFLAVPDRGPNAVTWNSAVDDSSELLAINSHEFLLLERDGKGLGDDSTAVVKRLYKIDIANAVDVSAISGEANLLPFAVPKTLFLDIRAKLNGAGVTDAQIPAKLEGAAFGADIVVNGATKHTLYIGNDNDFLLQSPKNHLATPNQWYVFTFSDADLGGSVFVPQTIATN